MTSPVWIAFMPEVLSGWLNSGPGADTMLESAAAWRSLSGEYVTAAEELIAVVDELQGQWQGRAEQRHKAAHISFITQLMKAAANSARMATANETMASTYILATETMPSLARLIANRVARASLAAVNFFGLATGLIAENEAEYAGMWIESADTMANYQAASDSQLSSAPDAAPMVFEYHPEPTTFAVGELPPLLYGIAAILYYLYQNAPFIISTFIISILSFFVMNPWLIVFIPFIFTPLLSIPPALAAAIPVSISVPVSASVNSLIGETNVNGGGAARIAKCHEAVSPLNEFSVRQSATRLSAARADVSTNPLAPVVAGDQGAGALGFGGTASKELVGPPSGLAALTEGELDGGPCAPMLPATWNPHSAGAMR